MSEAQDEKWLDGLSTRARGALWRAGVSSKEQAAHALPLLITLPDCGRKTVNEICAWLGLPEMYVVRSEDRIVLSAIRVLRSRGYKVLPPDGSNPPTE